MFGVRNVRASVVNFARLAVGSSSGAAQEYMLAGGHQTNVGSSDSRFVCSISSVCLPGRRRLPACSLGGRTAGATLFLPLLSAPFRASAERRLRMVYSWAWIGVGTLNL